MPRQWCLVLGQDPEGPPEELRGRAALGRPSGGAGPPDAAFLFTAGHTEVMRFEGKAPQSPRTTRGRLCKPATV